VRAARCGSRDALAELVGRHWDTAVFLAARVLGSVELGRDAAQEAAVAVLIDLARLRSPERFGAWFCGIALNVSRGWLRRLRPEVPGGPPDLVSALPSPAEAAEAADVAARVRAAVAALDGPAGPSEVDARPSDAANLALATGTPIRLHPALFEGEPPGDCALRLAACSLATAEIAAEARQRMRESWQRPGRGGPTA
jgi:hypothetical protein